MFLVNKDIVLIKMFYYCSEDDMFKSFAGDTRYGNWSVGFYFSVIFSGRLLWYGVFMISWKVSW